jgi:copper-binding protein NosD
MSTFRNVALVLPLVLAAPALAADRHVPSPVYPTIAAASAAAQPGDRIVVAPGIYREHVTSTVTGVTFVGRRALWDATLADGTAGVCLTASGGGTVVQGFTFLSGNQGPPCLDLTGDDCRVQRCSLRGTDSRLVSITGARARVSYCALIGARGDAIAIVGDDAAVEKLTASHTDDAVVHVTGLRARVARNKFDVSDGNACVNVEGDAASVLLNRFDLVRRGIVVTGNGTVVEGNKCRGGGDIFVTGDAVTVRANLFADGTNRVAIRVDSASAIGGGLVEDNVVDRHPVTAMDLRCTQVTVRRNRIDGCGTAGDAGILLNTASSLNQLFGNVVANCDGHAYSISGLNNVLTECVAIGATADGFHVAEDGNTLTDCRATGCGGEGLDNGADGTIVTGCVFRDNRIDVANDGTFANFAADNVFKTGGTSTLPQVD